MAFAIVYAILLLFGHQIESQSPAVGALIFTGIMVPTMDVIMPRLHKIVVRYTEYKH